MSDASTSSNPPPTDDELIDEYLLDAEVRGLTSPQQYRLKRVASSIQHRHDKLLGSRH